MRFNQLGKMLSVSSFFLLFRCREKNSKTAETTTALGSFLFCSTNDVKERLHAEYIHKYISNFGWKSENPQFLGTFSYDLGANSDSQRLKSEIHLMVLDLKNTSGSVSH